MNLRFEWINWNVQVVRLSNQSYDTDSNEYTQNEASATDSAKPYEPPHPSERRSIHVHAERVCVRTWSGARAAAHNAAERVRAGVEASTEVLAR
jgi:hypothetical protein